MERHEADILTDRAEHRILATFEDLRKCGIIKVSAETGRVKERKNNI